MKLPPLDKEKLGGENIDIQLNSKEPCNHTFKYVTAQEGMCEKCYMGAYLGAGDYIKNGHLYHGDELII